MPSPRTKSPEEYEIVKTKHFYVKPASVEEAILQMNMRNINSLCSAIPIITKSMMVYRRKDGKYGLLEPDSE